MKKNLILMGNMSAFEKMSSNGKVIVGFRYLEPEGSECQLFDPLDPKAIVFELDQMEYCELIAYMEVGIDASKYLADKEFNIYKYHRSWNCEDEESSIILDQKLGDSNTFSISKDPYSILRPDEESVPSKSNGCIEMYSLDALVDIFRAIDEMFLR